ncbi:MAG: hypothetical protein GDA50_04320 [Alphaproteobacteria bacterium GM202ARS2]|nr:hypothetical protein [Alphaproteobacteria bacterium GM202ARS2]
MHDDRKHHVTSAVEAALMEVAAVTGASFEEVLSIASSRITELQTALGEADVQYIDPVETPASQIEQL